MTSLDRDESLLDWTFSEVDAEIAARLAECLPARIIDIHAHLYHTAECTLAGDSMLPQGPLRANVEMWRARTGRHVGAARMQGALFLGSDHAGDELISTR